MTVTHPTLHSIQFDAELLQKYDLPLPRYTSYPPATELSDRFEATDFRRAMMRSNARHSPLSLYCHIPFCQSACYFCGCNVIVAGNPKVAEPYLQYLMKEIQQTAKLVDRSRPVVQLHWGGGTPNYLNLEQVTMLWDALHEQFEFDPQAEISIEVNPRYVDRDYIFRLRELGFNRISFGIQDFNPQVQAAINRPQSEELLFNVMRWIREAAFESANVDLIYGLPYQTLETYRETIQKTLALSPDRIAVFNFAYIPSLKAVQRHLPVDQLPSAEEKLRILQLAIEQLTTHNYQYIGMDHFAKTNDELAIAQDDGTLKRNFQGYTTQPDAELLGFGLTSISMLQDAYIQNHKRLKDYYQAIDAGLPPIERGVVLHTDDILRREIIMQLMCQFRLEKADVEARFKIDFDRYFRWEEASLLNLAQDGLLTFSPEAIEVTPKGRLLIRNIVSAFDIYLRDRQAGTNFSKAV